MKRMILVDGNSLMFRAFYGMNPMGIKPNSKGFFTNAIYGFARMMNVLVSSNYDNILVAFDAGKKTLRHEWMQDYKAGRAPMPDEFRSQIPLIKEYLDLMHIKRYEQDLYEADDIICTMSKRAEEAGYHVDIYSSDRDLLQLVSQNVTVHMNKKGMTELESYTPESFKEHYGIEVSSFIDLKALMGDKSDNLPGIPGIGEKKAIKYLQDYQNIENLISHADDIKGKDSEKIKENQDIARLCKKMATIIRDFDLPVSIDDTKHIPADKEKLLEFYTKLEIKSLAKELDLSNVAKKDETFIFKIIENENELKDILLNNSALLFETFEYNYHKSPILGLGLTNEKGNFAIPNSLISSNILKQYFEDDNFKKYTYDYKKAYVLLKRFNIDLKGVIFDLLLASYILNSDINQDEFRSVCEYYDYSDVLYDEEVYNKGAKKFIPSNDILFNHIAKKSKAIYELKDKSIELLKENNQLSLLNDIEIPLSRVLGKMEFEGMKIDKDELLKQKLSLEENIKSLENKIYEIVGFEFNISSPKQLGNVLFETLALPYPKKKKGDSYSTDIDVLNAIKSLNPIVDLIIEYRANTKLYSTYIIGLKDLIYPDGKVHTIFQQALTSTGRLSSIDPNLQNIPVRTELGHLIRKMFIPSNKNNKLYSSDYTQIELRVLADMAHVTHLIEAFNNGIDAHTRTAQLIFGHENITPEERRRAKTVNFGIVYGMSAFGLAEDLGISNVQAKNFIDKYYEIFPEIKTFMDNTIKTCQEKGYVETIFKRKRYIPLINSKIYMQREYAKRMAMNAPIQGSAADIMKIAMIRLDEALEKNNLKSKMIVQVHDEIVLEVENGEENIIQKIVKEAMENAYKLSIPLTVDDSFGNNWYEVK
jgi:DNA polymerase-1